MFVYVFDFCPIKLDITHNTCVALPKKTEFREGYCEIRISSLCGDVVHELSSVWRVCIFSKSCKGVY